MSGQRRRAKALGIMLEYGSKDLRPIVEKAVGKPCPYCEEIVTEKTFSLDHAIPVSRGGPHTLTNLAVSCLRCNQVKGMMTHREFDLLIRLIRRFDPTARRNLIARLRAGGRILRN